MAATLTAANRHDVTQLIPLVDAIPAVRGKRHFQSWHPGPNQIYIVWQFGKRES